MKSNLFLRVIILLFCLAGSFSARAELITNNEAQKWVEDKGHQLLATFGETDIVKKHAELDNMLLSFVDLDYVSKFVMGKYWRQMSSEQKDGYQSLFKRYALSIYKGFPLNFDSSKIDFSVMRVITENQKTTVRTKVKILAENAGNPPPISDIVVDFNLNKKNGQIKIIDLKLGESSLILSYRSRFYEMIARNDDDIDWFLEDLESITEAAERTNQEQLRQAEY